MLLKQNGIPLYHQLKEIFTEKISSGEWPHGGFIPNEFELCNQYSVSRGPVRQAIGLLVREGLLTRKQGKGTQVLPPKIERDLGGLYSFTTLIENKNYRHSARTLSLEIVKAEGSVAHYLYLQPGEPVFKFRRLRLANDEPLILETVYLPKKECNELSEAQLATAPLYTILESCYDLPPLRAKQFFEPTIADEYEANILEIEEGAPVLLLQNITYTTGNRPIVLSKAIVRGDRVRYLVELTKPIPPP